MKNKKIKRAILIALIIILTLGGSIMFLSPKQTIIFSENQEFINNPFQGFYIQVDSSEPDKMHNVVNQNLNLALLAYNLHGYQKDEIISQEKLAELENALSLAEELNIQIIFRAAYSFSDRTKTKEPETMNIVLSHIEQISPILNKFQNIILCVQSGMLGPWGEGHSSTLFINQQRAYEARNQVALKWYDTLSDTLQIQLRTPGYIRDAVSAGVPISRLGLHNDAFFSSSNDMGTYTSRTEDIQWINQSLSHSKTGGETAILTDYSHTNNAINEFDTVSLTYLNSRYNSKVLDLWNEESFKGETGYDYIKKHMGLRLYLNKAIVPKRFSPIQNNISLTIKNTGFGKSINNLNFKIIVNHSNNIQYIEPDSITFKNNEILLNIKLPSELMSSNTKVGLWAGYIDPNSNLNFTFANEPKYMDESIVYFATYENNRFFSSLI